MRIGDTVRQPLGAHSGFIDGRPRHLIDFDRAEPGSRRSDLAYMAWCWLVGFEDVSQAPTLEERLRQLRLLLDTYNLVDRGSFAAAIAAEQRQVLSLASESGDSSAAAWVRHELAFVREHAAHVDAAAGP